MASESTIGELVYEVKASLTSITEHGVSFEKLASGGMLPPPEGARVDVAFEGEFAGPRLKGRLSGVDYLHMRADGRIDLHIHASITADDGERVAFFADGVATPSDTPGVFNLRENATLQSGSPAYQWVNGLQVWAIGTANVGTGELNVKGYAA